MTLSAKAETRASDPVILSVKNLTTAYATRHAHVLAVRDVSFDVHQGEKVGLVGESASGKSTLALSILGLLDPPARVVAGAVWLNGRNIVGLRDGQLRRIRGREVSLILQNPMTALDPVKSIGSQITETLFLHQEGLSKRSARRRAVELLREVEISGAESRLGEYPHQFSGGMRQRVMIAIALANEPDLIIADEPTTALDVTTQAQVLALLDRLVSRRKTAVILITHNLGVVAQFCGVIQVMYAGRIVERGATAAVFRSPGHPYTEALLKAIPRPQLGRGPLAAIPGSPPALDALPRGCTFEPRCPLGHGEELCRETSPIPPRAFEAPSGRYVECHFAHSRLNEGSWSPVTEGSV